MLNAYIDSRNHSYTLLCLRVFLSVRETNGEPRECVRTSNSLYKLRTKT